MRTGHWTDRCDMTEQSRGTLGAKSTNVDMDSRVADSCRTGDPGHTQFWKEREGKGMATGRGSPGKRKFLTWKK